MRAKRGRSVGALCGLALTVVLSGCGSTTSSTAGPSAAAVATAVASPRASAAAEDVLHVLAIGDSIPFGGHFCPGCTAFVDRYGAQLHDRTGRPVAVNNRSRDDSATMEMIDKQVLGEFALRQQIRESQIVIVSVGFNNVMPDTAQGVGCRGDMGTTAESYITWVLASKPDCQQDGLDRYAAMYDRIFSTITGLRAGQPTVYAVVNVHDGNLGTPDFVNANLPQQTKDRMDRWLIDRYDRWNAMECDRATAHGFTCVDVYHAFNGQKGNQPSGSVNTIDGAHPSQTGNDLIAGLLGKLDLTAVSP